LESFVKLVKKKHDENLKSVNLTKAKGLMVVRWINVNKNHHSKTFHLFVEIYNHLVEGLVDTRASMSVMLASVVRELGIIHLISGSKSYKTTSGVVIHVLGRISELHVKVGNV
jgi:hypothetical protein